MRPVTRPSPREKVTVRLTPTEAAQLRALAEQQGVSATQLARWALLDGLPLFSGDPARSEAVIVPDRHGLTLHIKARGVSQAALIHDLLFRFLKANPQ
jgi:hypothetical protein